MCAKAIIQNKLDKISDLEEKADFMKYECLQEFSKKHKFDICFQTSAKTGENIEKSISGFIKLVIDKYERYYGSKIKEMIVDETNKTIILSSNNKTQLKESINDKPCCK